MELWIRSQNKEFLHNISFVYLSQEINDNGTIDICGNCITLGTYKSKERALEVLDEIQNILKPQVILKKGKIEGCPDGYEIKELSTVIYEMPEE